MARALGIVIGSDAFVCTSGDRPDITRIPAVLGFGPHSRPVLGRPSGNESRCEYRDFTSRVGDPVPVVAGGEARSGTGLVATAIGCLAEGAPVVVAAHPAAWTEHAAAELRDALSANGTPALLVSDAEAAYVALRAVAEISDHATILLCNAGGAGTEIAVVRPSGDGSLRVERATRSHEFGGELVDSLLFEHILTELSDTHPEFDPSDRRNWIGLRELRGRVTHAKQLLSRDMSAVLEVNLPGIREHLRVVRAELEALIAEPVAQVVQRIARTADAAVQTGGTVEAIVLIGGSSVIPLLTERLSVATELPIVNGADPGTTVARGTLLLAAARSAAGAPPVATAMPKVPAPPRRVATAPRSPYVPAPPSRPATVAARPASKARPDSSSRPESSSRPAPAPPANTARAGDKRRRSRPMAWMMVSVAATLAVIGGALFGVEHHTQAQAQNVSTTHVVNTVGGTSDAPRGRG